MGFFKQLISLSLIFSLVSGNMAMAGGTPPGSDDEGEKGSTHQKKPSLGKSGSRSDESGSGSSSPSLSPRKKDIFLGEKKTPLDSEEGGGSLEDLLTLQTNADGILLQLPYLFTDRDGCDEGQYDFFTTSSEEGEEKRGRELFYTARTNVSEELEEGEGHKSAKSSLSTSPSSGEESGKFPSSNGSPPSLGLSEEQESTSISTGSPVLKKQTNGVPDTNLVGWLLEEEEVIFAESRELRQVDQMDSIVNGIFAREGSDFDKEEGNNRRRSRSGSDLEEGRTITLKTLKLARKGKLALLDSSGEEDDKYTAALREVCEEFDDLLKVDPHRAEFLRRANQVVGALFAAALPRSAEVSVQVEEENSVMVLESGEVVNDKTSLLAPVINGESAVAMVRTLPEKFQDPEEAKRFIGFLKHMRDHVLEDKLNKKQIAAIVVAVIVAVGACTADASIFQDSLRYLLTKFGETEAFLDGPYYQNITDPILIVLSLLNGIPQLVSIAKSLFTSGDEEFCESEYRWPLWKLRLARSFPAFAMSILNWAYFSSADFEYMKSAEKKGISAQRFIIPLVILSPFVLLKYGAIGWDMACELAEGKLGWLFGGRKPHIPHLLRDEVDQYRYDQGKALLQMENVVGSLPDVIVEQMHETFFQTSAEPQNEREELALVFYRFHQMEVWYQRISSLGLFSEDVDEGISSTEEWISIGTAVASIPPVLIGFWIVWEVFFSGVLRMSEETAFDAAWTPAIFTVPFAVPLVYVMVRNFFEKSMRFWKSPHDHHSQTTQRIAAMGWSGVEGPFRAITEWALMWQAIDKMGGHRALWVPAAPFIASHVIGNVPELGGPYAETLPDWLGWMLNRCSKKGVKTMRNELIRLFRKTRKLNNRLKRPFIEAQRNFIIKFRVGEESEGEGIY